MTTGDAGGCLEWDDHLGMERRERTVVGNKGETARIKDSMET